HAGAALVAQGYLRQDQLWPVLRAHAEWILGKSIAIDVGTAIVEPDAPGRLRGEPSVFGGSTGAEVFVEVVRRVVAQEDAFARLGGGPARISEGRNEGLLTECALGAPEVAVLEQLRGTSLAQALAASPDTDMIAVLYALHLLGVIEVLRSVGGPPARDPGSSPRGMDTIDDDAIRARVRARLDLVEEGDYFAVLGVARTATSYEVRRAFSELRRMFDPDRILTPAMADLAPSVHKILSVIEEAYDILHDAARRERYRRAIDAVS
ncbi:MAG: DnaJ domain-containing protein, partial [Polyangiaceae bacterium]